MSGWFPFALPPQVVGGIAVGSPGTSGIYLDHILSWGDEFSDALNLVGPATPRGKYFASKGYSAGPRGNTTLLAASYDVDPLTTGHLDSNRGIPVGYNNITQSSSLLTLNARLATIPERAGFAKTDPTFNGGVRTLSSSIIHSEGAIGFYPAASPASVIVEANLKYVGNSQLGWHPDFWTNTANPMNTFNPVGSFDSLNACEGNSFEGNSSDNRFINGVSSQPALSSAFTDLYDGSFHLISMVLQNGSWFVYIDGVLKNTLAVNANNAALPQYFVISSHVIAAPPLGITWFGENFSQSAWTSTGASIIVDYVRVWRPSTAAHFIPRQTIPDLVVSYNGTGSIVLPSLSSLWGDISVTEYVQAVPAEVNEPGMSFNTNNAGSLIYNQFPSGVTYNSGTRTVNVDFSAIGGSAGILHCTAKAWKPDGSTFVPARFSIVRGPRMISTGKAITVGSPATVDLYVVSDVGVATPKTISVTGLPTGMSFNPTTGLATGTPGNNATASITTTNSFGTSITANFNFGSFQDETYALLARGATQSSTTQNAIDACIISLKSAGVWANIQALVWHGLSDSSMSLLNWKGDYWNPVLNGSPSWIQYQGFTTDGATNGINTNYNPSTATTLNALSLSVWSNTAGQTTSGGIGNFHATTPFNGFTMNLRTTTDTFAFRANDPTSDNMGSVTDGTGLFTGMRVAASGAACKKAYRNGVSLSTTTTASTIVDNSTLGIGSIGSSIGSTSFSNRQWAGYVIRNASFADADELAIYNALNTLHGAVGP